jgi:hypothetical protein
LPRDWAPVSEDQPGTAYELAFHCARFPEGARQGGGVVEAMEHETLDPPGLRLEVDMMVAVCAGRCRGAEHEARALEDRKVGGLVALLDVLEKLHGPSQIEGPQAGRGARREVM